MVLRLPEIRLRHIEAEDGKSGPDLLDEIQKTSGAAAGIEKSQPALIASGERFVERRQRLPSGCIRCPIEEHLDLRVVALCGIVRPPAARLEVEILQIVAGPLPPSLLVEHFGRSPALPAPGDVCQIFEEESRAPDERRHPPLMTRH